MNLVRTRLQHISGLNYVRSMGFFAARYRIEPGIGIYEPESYTLNESTYIIREFQGMSYQHEWEVDLRIDNVPWGICYEYD